MCEATAASDDVPSPFEGTPAAQALSCQLPRRPAPTKWVSGVALTPLHQSALTTLAGELRTSRGTLSSKAARQPALSVGQSGDCITASSRATTPVGGIRGLGRKMSCSAAGGGRPAEAAALRRISSRANSPSSASLGLGLWEARRGERPASAAARARRAAAPLGSEGGVGWRGKSARGNDVTITRERRKQPLRVGLLLQMR